MGRRWWRRHGRRRVRNHILLLAAACLVAVLAVASCGEEGNHDSDGPPEWVKVGQDNDSLTVYLSTAPAAKVGDDLVTRLLVFYRKPHQGVSQKPFTIGVWQVEYDCPNHRWAMRSTVGLSVTQRDTLDRVIYATPEWHSDSEGASGQLVAQRACFVSDSTRAR